MKWALLGIGIVAAYWLVKYPYAVGALIKHPAELNEAAKQLNTLSNAVSGVGDLVDTLKSDWASIEAHI